MARTVAMLVGLLAAGAGVATAQAPATVQPSPRRDQADLERRLDAVTNTLEQTARQLQQTLAEVVRLRAEVADLRTAAGVAVSPVFPPPPPSNAASSSSSEPAITASRPDDTLDALRERQDVLEAAVRQHDQTKVETDSKYNLKVTGLVLFNAYANQGVVDSTDLPEAALPRDAGAAHGSLGGTIRQTVLGVAASGPTVLGARTAAFANLDMFGESTSPPQLYDSLGSSYVRLRNAELSLNWKHATVAAGNTDPLFSPLNPTSYASVAAPALSGSGNLWGWWPQLRAEGHIPFARGQQLSLAGGLIVPSTPEVGGQPNGPVEASRRPGVEGRVAYTGESAGDGFHRQWTLGLAAYSARQRYASGFRLHSWAVAGDFDLRPARAVALSGEIYRGRALGGFGGGWYQDLVTGTETASGLPATAGVEAAGGWSQLKLSWTPRMETNFTFGLDDAFADSFRRVAETSGGDSPILWNATVGGNLVFHPRSSLLVSPEYRHLLTRQFSGARSVADVYTLTFGYQF